MRSARRWWLIVAIVSSALMAMSFVTVLLTPVPLTPNLYVLGSISFPVVGGLVVAHQADNLVGRLMVLIGCFEGVATAATTYLWTSLETGLSRLEFFEWLAIWPWWPATALTALVVAALPSGRIASSWINVSLKIATGAMLLLTVIVMVLPGSVNTVFFGEDVTNPYGLEVLTTWSVIGDVVPPALSTALLAFVVVDLAVRWRRSVGVERLQMRWVWWGLGAVIVVSSFGVLADAIGRTDQLVWVAVWTGFGALPGAIGLAVTRYRLYEIDRLISRTVSYAVVVGVLAAIYTAIAVGLPLLLRLPDDSPLLVSGATLAVAAVFSPLRRRVQDVVDKRFNRSRYDAHQEVGRFADRLRSRLGLDGLRGEILRVAARTMQPDGVSVWIRPSGRESI